MSNNEQPNSLVVIKALDKNAKIVVINSEHDVLLEQITKELNDNEYNSIVTMENYSAMDLSAKKLGTSSKFISRFRIDKKDSEMSDIKLFEENLKGYCSLIDKKQQTIKDVLEVFKEETRKQITKVCKAFLEECLNELNIRVEFRNIDVSDMTKTTYMTATGNIAKPAKDEIIARVNIKNNLQNKIDNRILSLENECLKNGIEPLTTEHIQGFLHEDDETYNSKLQSLIGAEITRNEKIKADAKIKAEQEARFKVVAEQKALKDELHARYEGRIKYADVGEITTINIELQSYDSTATYALKTMCNDRQKELETPKVEEVKEEQVIDETPQEDHLKSIAQEPIKKQEVKQEVPKDGKVLKTISCTIKVSASESDERIKNHIFAMIQAGSITADMFEVV
jgi:hypothetical protein